MNIISLLEISWLLLLEKLMQYGSSETALSEPSLLQLTGRTSKVLIRRWKVPLQLGALRFLFSPSIPIIH